MPSPPTVKPGDFVIAPFTHGCGHCAACLAGFDGSCQSHDNKFRLNTSVSPMVNGRWLRFLASQATTVRECSSHC